MNQRDNRETNNQSIIIEDLSAQNAEEIKGGPRPIVKRDVILKTSATENQSEDDDTLGGTHLNHNESVVSDEDEREAGHTQLADLPITEGREEQTKGGGGHVKVFDGATVAAAAGDNTNPGFRFNHNESVVADTDDEPEAETARLADLSVTEEQEEQVKGGLPAIQKVRDAASRVDS